MTNSTLKAIAANTSLLVDRLERATALARAAYEATQQGEQNLAIGTLLPAQEDLADADALLRTIFVLHRSRADMTKIGGAQ